ncbi:MAG TPA: response regulator [Oculatellaceae cyanobacterium]
MSARILALFDSDEAQNNVRAHLEPQNELFIVRTSSQALQRIQNQQFDLVLCAAHLTDESFFDFLKSLRRAQDRADRTIPFICCSTSRSEFSKTVEEPIRQACRLLGGDHYLTTDEFFSDQLPHEVEKLLGPIATRGHSNQ